MRRYLLSGGGKLNLRGSRGSRVLRGKGKCAFLNGVLNKRRHHMEMRHTHMNGERKKPHTLVNTATEGEGGWKGRALYFANARDGGVGVLSSRGDGFGNS